jgi:UDP-N-acetylmuramate dehydrogenase
MNDSNLEGLREHADLKTYTTFGVTGVARYLLEFHDLAALKAGVEFARDQRLPLLVLGQGSNVLLLQGFLGLVLVNRLLGKERLDQGCLKVAGGEDWHELVLWCSQQKLHGLENLALIPGTVGAAPIQNIGAYGVEVASYINQLTAYDTQLAREVVFGRGDCDFAYRDSLFKHAPVGRYIILEVVLQLAEEFSPNLSYGALAEVFANCAPPSSGELIEAVCRIRRSKLPDPRLLGNAGSFFKNPLVSEGKIASLQQQGFDLPHFPSDDKDLYRVPAAWLLEQAGWKGRVRGQAAVHQDHALVLVNLGSASGEEIFLLAQEMSNSVLQKFGIALQPEVRLI